MINFDFIFRLIHIGFCTKQFPLQGKCLGDEENSIGIDAYVGMGIDGQYKLFGNEEEYFGVGIIHCPANSPMKSFATWNCQLLGKINLKF